MLKKQTMKLDRSLCDIPLSPIHLRNRDASSVMLTGSQAWDWGFLTHHALFIVQSNRVCKMRITQHEENRGEETWGEERGRREEREGSKGERWCGRERDKGEGKKKGSDSGHCQIFISYPFQVNPRTVSWVCEQWGGGNEYGTGSPDSSTRLAHNLHLLNVHLVSRFVFWAQTE